MPDISLVREHTLGLGAARNVANAWADQLRYDFGMDCRMDPGVQTDILHFSRSGVSGTLQLSATRFTVDIRLDYLLTPLRDRIEDEVSRTLDQLLKPAVPGGARLSAAGSTSGA